MGRARGLVRCPSMVGTPGDVRGISSSSAANEAMESMGADGSIGKFQLANHEVWQL